MSKFNHFSLVRLLVGVTVLVFLTGLVLFKWLWSPVLFTTGTVTLPDGTSTQVEIADHPKEHRQGLMDRLEMQPDTGMLFIFSTPGTYTFWMKRTHVDLDFVWLSQGKVVDLRTGVPAGWQVPKDQIARVRPQVPVDAVLEVPAGWVDRHDIQVGDILTYHLPDNLD